MIDEGELRTKLAQAIDGKGAFRRFKDVLMSFGPERERWFTFRSERLRTFMEALLSAHAIKAIERPQWADGPTSPESEPMPDSVVAPPSTADLEGPKSASGRRTRNAEASRLQLREISEALGPRELETLVSFAEFLKARRAARGFAHHHEHQREERQEGVVPKAPPSAAAAEET